MKNNTENARSWIRLNLVQGITREKYLKLINIFTTPENIFSAKESDIRSAGFTDNNFIKNLMSPPDDLVLDKEIKLIEKHNVSVMTIIDDDYPENLKTAISPPPILYIKGSLDKLDKFSLTVVGTRQPTEYGKWATKTFIKKLSEWGIVIVSGMASGIDSVSHKAALAAGGRTIAILGNGLAKCYPAVNKRLMDEISEKGAVISEFPMETPPNAYNFPVRNEILASFGLATLVVEASYKSGSLITARLALDENRMVFAIPGDINRETSRGTNYLIRSGATSVLSPEDILEDLKPQLKGLLIDARSENLNISDKRKTKQLSEKEMPIYNFIKREPQSIDTLSDFISETEITMPELYNILLKMEITGYIEKLPGQIYTIKS